MARLVIVSNRVPVPKTRGAQAGGLAVALKDVLTPGAMWFGWSGRIALQSAEEPSIVESRGVTYATLDLSRRDYEQFYVGFANSALWPLFHFRPMLMRFERADYAGYLDVNRMLAAQLAKLLEPDDLVWVHDYHLIPMARYLRELGVQNRIGFFLHVPFPPPASLVPLPTVHELLSDLCRYDLVGFQTENHARDFKDCADRLLGAKVAGEVVTHDGNMVRVIADPIGIDAEPFERDAVRSVRSADSERLIDSLGGRALMIGVDRLDYSKGLPNRFEGYGRLLDRHPELHRKVSFLQIAARSREDVAAYRDLVQELDQLAGDVNGRYSDFDWAPLRYVTRASTRRTLAGFFRLARVGVVTPLIDGMNLVAKEFVAAQDSKDPGVLILSRFAGAAEQMGDALLVNPYHIDDLAEAMYAALTMGLEERQRRHFALRAMVFGSTAAVYANRFLNALRGGVVTPLGIADAALARLAQSDWRSGPMQHRRHGK